MEDASRTPPADALPAALDYAPPVPLRERTGSALRVLRALLAPGIALALVAAGLLLVLVNGGRRTPALTTSCAANLRSIGQGIAMYAGDHGRAFPDTLARLHPTYVPDARVFLCPTDLKARAPITEPQIAADLRIGRRLSYVYLGRGLDMTTAPPDAVIAFEWPHGEGPHQHFVSVLFADGHAEPVRDFGPILDQLVDGVRPVRLRTSFPTSTRPATRPSTTGASTATVERRAGRQQR